MPQRGVQPRNDSTPTAADAARRSRDEEHTRLWAQAGRDPEFLAEMQELWEGFATDDRLAWRSDPA